MRFYALLAVSDGGNQRGYAVMDEQLRPDAAAGFWEAFWGLHDRLGVDLRERPPKLLAGSGYVLGTGRYIFDRGDITGHDVEVIEQYMGRVPRIRM